jgi:putative tricarboxylic transport membrane protein
LEAIGNLFLGFSIALSPANLFWCFVGVFLGTIVGVLPGLGPPATIALLLPLTFKMDPTTAMIMMAGIYYGAKYGGSTTSILLNVPGESSSVVTCLDGYQLARQGRAGAALGIAAIASFVAGTFGVLGLMFLAPPVAKFALRFGPPEYFGLMVLGLAMVAFLTGRSVVKGILTTLVGCGWRGWTDVFTAQSRFTFGQMELLDGIDFIVVSIGLFAIGEVLVNLESKTGGEIFKVPKGLRHLLPSLQDLKDSRFAFLNGSVVGFFIGVLPGAGSTIASFLSYGLKRRSLVERTSSAPALSRVAAPRGQ